ncbi:carbohydrate-binding domain-containing protein [Methylobacterium haplocladii]|uniref:Uncharacterized protein n=1 Tax=Methylobacterium haplocladii TaxID=1176176 RepID=A0A512IK84_9HYPH|nr:carbohydrate-binding domain-containing protein [Methylobacterium haplocladii]GEO98130.1 hypothetical protein MHA02_05180 [Methylobacterium haplocladii]GJD83624.1 hypothetical protein HPGCJGGD_1494 [Methylobacterium haplocladii]GLS60351.1 hypothetical protein GCM10007887_30300 [Methylobacterium haplocladii]
MANKVTFKISEDEYLGNAQFIVKVDGVQIGDVLTATAAHSSGQSEDFSFSGDFSSAHQFSVTYLNDLYNGPGNDRDLYVDSFTFDGHTKAGSDTLSNTGITAGTSANLITTNDTASYDVSQYTSQPTDHTPSPTAEHLNPIYRFVNVSNGDHLFTTDINELNSVLKTSPDYHFEGVVGSTPDKGSNTQDVFRFFDTVHGQHFYTSDVTERDTVLKTLPSYHYEGVAFQAYTDPTVVGSGGETLERFFNTQTGAHMYSADATEIKSINGGQQGPGWIDEGKVFTVHVATDTLLHA